MTRRDWRYFSGFFVRLSGKSGCCESGCRKHRPVLWFDSGKSGKSGFLRRTFLYTMYAHILTAPDFVRSSYNKTKKNSLFPLFPLFNRNPGQKPKIGSFKNSLFPLFQWKNSRSHSPDSLYAWSRTKAERPKFQPHLQVLHRLTKSKV